MTTIAGTSMRPAYDRPADHGPCVRRLPHWRPAVAALTLALLAAPSARAGDYPWCYVDQTMSGSTYCAFATLAQCRENAGGNGGFCIQNPRSNPPWRGSPGDARAARNPARR